MNKTHGKDSKIIRLSPHIFVGLAIFILAPIYLLNFSSSTNRAQLIYSPTVTVTHTPPVTSTPALTNQQTVPPVQKDIWDKIYSVSGLVSGIAIAVIGGLATYLYRERERTTKQSRDKQELAILELQATQGFFPYILSKNDKEVELALLAISLLGTPKLATNLAAYIDKSGARKAVASIVKTNDMNIPYKFKIFKETHDIQPNGDINFERITEIEAIEAPVSYAFLSVGVTQGKLAEKIKFSATNPILGKELVCTVAEDYPTRKLIIAFLDPPAIIGKNSTARFQLQWTGPYTQLIKQKWDNARIRLDHKVDNLEILLIAPKDLHFSDITFDELKPTIKFSIDPNNRSVAKITAKNVRVGVYNYTIKCKPK